jgi:hypothetical protein
MISGYTSTHYPNSLRQTFRNFAEGWLWTLKMRTIINGNRCNANAQVTSFSHTLMTVIPFQNCAVEAPSEESPFLIILSIEEL